MNIELIEKIKELTLISIVSDDYLFEILVLKGGNALNLVHKLSTRNSMDLDFSMEEDYFLGKVNDIKDKFENSLIRNFIPINLVPFDVKITKRPGKIPEDLKNFWGGYSLEFKLITNDLYQIHHDDIDNLRRNAFNPGSSTKFTVDISPFEYVKHKKLYIVSHYNVYTYTPAMIVCEKLRAICQQTNEYGHIINRQVPKARPRDFYDIYYIVTKLEINMLDVENINILKEMFLVKKVPLEILSLIENYKSLHESNSDSLKSTVAVDSELLDFNEYFEYTIQLANEIQSAIM